MNVLATKVKHEHYWLDDFQGDKYAVDSIYVDCKSRIHKCKAACCRLPFALTQQDLTDAVKLDLMLWDPDLRYSICQTENNYCCQLNQENYKCSIYSHRPYICRMYDCSKDERIWKDFEQMEVNPQILQLYWPFTLSERT